MSRFYFLVGPDTTDRARALQETCVIEVKHDWSLFVQLLMQCK